MIYERKLWPKIQKYLEHKDVLVITGPRRVGKTTTVNWLLEQVKSDNKLFLDVENVINRQIFEVNDYEDVVSRLAARGLDTSQRMYVAIDEIQFITNLPSIIKYLFDHYDIKFILTGSSSYYLKNHFKESLAGRKFLFELLPFDFEEYLGVLGVNYKLNSRDVFGSEAKFDNDAYNTLRNHYEDYTHFGGFPSVILASDHEEKELRLTGIFSDYINIDVETLGDFRATTELRKLVSLLASRVGNRLNIQELSNITGLSRQTVQNYVEFLEQTYLIKTIEVESNSPDVKNRKLKKLYFVDTGIAHINAQLSSGQEFENTVFTQLFAANNKVTYFENNEFEIDFITYKNGKDSGNVVIEAKETPTPTDFSTLQRRSKRLEAADFCLIGKEKSAKFDNYVWGGSI